MIFSENRCPLFGIMRKKRLTRKRSDANDRKQAKVISSFRRGNQCASRTP
jgi:hypothetical protein